jgi:hypothetical protein
MKIKSHAKDQTLGPIWKSRDDTGVDLENVDVLSRTNW